MRKRIAVSMSIGLFLLSLFNFYGIYKASGRIYQIVTPCLSGKCNADAYKGALVKPGIIFFMLAVFAILFSVFAVINLLLTIFYFAKNYESSHKK